MRVATLVGVQTLMAIVVAACGERALPAIPSGDSGTAAPDPLGPQPVADGGAPDNGSAALEWQEVIPPAELELAGLQILSASAAATDDLFFVSTNATIVRWREGQWSREIVAPSSPWAPSRVSAFAPDDVWAELGGVLYHRDASAWSRDDSWQAAIAAQASAMPATVGPIRAVGPGEMWMVVRADPAGTLLHRHGGVWEARPVQPAPAPPAVYDFSDLATSSAGDVWLGGGLDDDTGPTETPALLFHFDGAAWTTFGVGLWNVDALWTAYMEFPWMAIPEGSGLSTLARFDAAQGKAVYQSIEGWPGDGIEVHSLWGRAADDVWTAGDDVAHWDGQSWRRADGVPDGARPPVNRGSGQTIVAGDARSVWLISGGPRFFRLGPPL